MRITHKILKDAGACVSQRRLFIKLFGREGGKVTLARLKKARAAGLSISWFANNFLDDQMQCTYENDPRIVFCRDRYDMAPPASRREDVWRQKLHNAQNATLLRCLEAQYGKA